jgi:hypothetical protein
MLENPNIVPFQDPACFDLRWMFGAQIGKDTTSNFTLSFNGLAVKTADNKFVVPVLEQGSANLVDVTCLTIGIDPYVWRIPIAFESVKPGHLLVRADSPFSLIFVEEVDVKERRIHGLDPLCDQVVDIVVPERTLDVPSFLVRVVSLFDGFDGEGFEFGRDDDKGEFGNMLPFLLCCGGNGAAGAAPNNLLMALMLSRGGGGMRNMLPLLLLSSGSQCNPALQTILLASMFSGGKGLFGFGRREMAQIEAVKAKAKR